MNFETWFPSRHPQIPLPGVAAVLKLAAEGATVPFMARYRKEQTGALDEVAIQQVLQARQRWDDIQKRQQFIVSEIERQKKLTPELEAKILAAFDLNVLEDLYLPYKLKRKTKATLAREAGLQELADWIWNCGHGTDKPQPGQTLELWAFTFRNPDKDVNDVEAVLQGAQDILTERLAETQELRQLVRSAVFEKGCVRTQKASKAKPHSKYEKYFDYHEAIGSLVQPQNSHRYLALRRGWMEDELVLSIGGTPQDTEFDERLARVFEAAACSVPDSPGAAILAKAARQALKGHVEPSIDAEVHAALKDAADIAAIRVFAENVRQLLLASPFGAKAVLGIDPGLRTGCKLAVVDDGGRYVASTVMHVQSDEGKVAARALLGELLKGVSVRAIAVGNGTAGRETEVFVRSALKELGVAVPVVMVNEAGASVYSASDAAREEFPELDVTVRGAISIARRLQDPLAELVKIDPKSVGVGQYQHDVSPHALKRSLDQVVESCVNGVGVNLNTASYHLLAHVAGIGPSLAKAIVTYREKNGLFRSRRQLFEVPRFSRKSFEQAAGFLRIPGGEEPLDNTGVHPERYPALESLAGRLQKEMKDLLGPGVELVRSAGELREELGAYTFEDILKELEKPGRDPREAFVPFQYREDVYELKDLKPGMACPGIVTNVTNFGAFVDIGVHHDGLVHISQLSNRFVKDPREAVKPGDRVSVRVLEVNLDKGQIALTMKPEPPPRPAREPRKAPPVKEQRPRPRPASVERKPATAKAARPAAAPPRAAPPRAATPPRTPRPVPSQPAKPAKPSFNNPFAGLASLRETLRKQGR